LYFFSAPHVAPPLAFDVDGRSKEPRFSIDELEKLIAFDETVAYIADQDVRTGEFSLVRVARDEVSGVFKDKKTEQVSPDH